MFNFFKKTKSSYNDKKNTPAFIFYGDIYDIINLPRFNYKTVTFILGRSASNLSVGDKIIIDNMICTIEIIENEKHKSVSHIKNGKICSIIIDQDLSLETRNKIKPPRPISVIDLLDLSGAPAVEFSGQLLYDNPQKKSIGVKAKKELKIGDKLMIEREPYEIIEIYNNVKVPVEKLSEGEFGALFLDREFDNITIHGLKFKLDMATPVATSQVTFNFA